jgi:hypothetical protein
MRLHEQRALGRVNAAGEQRRRCLECELLRRGLLLVFLSIQVLLETNVALSQSVVVHNRVVAVVNRRVMLELHPVLDRS